MPAESGEPNPWTKQISDTLADADAVREGLHDDEALPLVDWGTAQAQALGARMAAPETPSPTPEQAAETGYALVRLMTRITWVVTYRHKKDAAWLTRTFHKINDLSRELHGPDAPTLSEDEIAAWIADHAAHTNGELVQSLIARLTPGASSAPDASGDPGIPGDPGQPGETSEPTAPSTFTHAPGPLPGRGDNDEQESVEQ